MVRRCRDRYDVGLSSDTPRPVGDKERTTHNGAATSSQHRGFGTDIRVGRHVAPNSILEAEQIRADTGTSTPMSIVPNGVDHRIFTPPHSSAHRRGVPIVGRLEPHKNQLGLIRELRGTGIPLTIVGPEHPHHSKYASRCRAEAGRFVTFVGDIDHEDLPDLFRNAAVHVLPSWFETTGLVSLEAAASGCAVVTTNRGYAREYFLDLVHYCDPGVKGSIRAAVRRALETPVTAALRRRVVDNFTWEHAARATLKATLMCARRWPVAKG